VLDVVHVGNLGGKVQRLNQLQFSLLVQHGYSTYRSSCCSKRRLSGVSILYYHCAHCSIIASLSAHNPSQPPDWFSQNDVALVFEENYQITRFRFVAVFQLQSSRPSRLSTKNRRRAPSPGSSWMGRLSYTHQMQISYCSYRTKDEQE